MPLYEYQCESCSHRFERIQKFSDPPVDTCPACGGRVQKLLSSPAIQFKGSGWYITDYAKKPAAKDAKPPTAAKESGDSGSSTTGESGTKESKDTSSTTSSKTE